MTKQIQFTQSIRAWMDVFMHRSMRGWGRFAKSTGLSMPQFSVMMQLHYRGACGMSRISEGYDITPAAASQLVDKLVQSELIQRVEDPNDRRAKLLNLTDKGKELIQRGMEVMPACSWPSSTKSHPCRKGACTRREENPWSVASVMPSSTRARTARLSPRY